MEGLQDVANSKAPSTKRLRLVNLKKARRRAITSLFRALATLGAGLLLVSVGKSAAKEARLSQPAVKTTNRGASSGIHESLDRFGGDTRLKSKIHNVGVTFFGKSTSLSVNSLTDRNARFPIDGRLVGKLVSPDYKHPESASSPEKWFRIVANTQTTITTKPADGDLTKYAKTGDLYEVTGVFATERIGHRWWFIDPDGNVFFPKAVSKTDTWEPYSNSGGTVQAYDAVYLETRDGKFTHNLWEEALNPRPRDVVDEDGVTLCSVGDTIYIGSLKPFDVTYFDVSQLGKSGKVDWYYSAPGTPSRWQLLNGSGNPAEGASLNSDGSYNLDGGNYLAPDPSTGQLADHDPKANRIYWWTLNSSAELANRSLFPTDFQPLALPVDSVPRYYIKGVVTIAFHVPPVLAQLYDAAPPSYLPLIKYSYPPGANPYFNWFKAITARYRLWGWNAAGQYSHQYLWLDGNSPSDRLPVEVTIPLSSLAMDASQKWHIKNVYDRQQCPPGSGHLLYQGHMADVFDPNYKTAIKALADEMIDSNPWAFEIVPEEGDDVYGLNKMTHEHMGYVILSQNPFKPTCCSSTKQPTAPNNSIPVTDTTLYSKYALRDFLRFRYKSADDHVRAFTIHSRVPAYTYHRTAEDFELAALRRLNHAWGTAYTTWGTSSGSLMDGTNTWGTGTGFMDENGRGVYPGDCRISYQDFHKPGYPQVKTDLDAFVAFFAKKYGSIIYPAVKVRTANLVAIPLYSPPPFVAEAVRPYTDVLWTSLDSVDEARQVYNHLHKPLVVADYLAANPASPLDFGGRIRAVAYDAQRNRTTISFTGRPYMFGHAWPIEFPGLTTSFKAFKVGQPGLVEAPDTSQTASNGVACGGLPLHPVPTKIGWYKLEIAGNYTVPGCLAPGQRIRIAARGQQETQVDRARAMEQRIRSFINAHGKDGNYFVAGWEHWDYLDWPLLGPSEYFDFGLVTAHDNAYDGIEDRRAVGKDRKGRFVGGEAGDYGNLEGTLAPFLHDLYGQLIRSSR